MCECRKVGKIITQLYLPKKYSCPLFWIFYLTRKPMEKISEVRKYT